MTATVDNAVADLQRANAKLQRQLDERTAERDGALARETATAEVLQVINSSPGDLAPVFDAMLDRATSLCEAAFGVLWIIDGERIRAAATHNVPSSYRDFLEREVASSPGPNSGVAQTIRAKSPLLFADAAAGAAYESGDPFAVAAVELGGVRTLLNAPLVKDDAVLGVLAVYRKEVRLFSDKQIALLQNFAAQAVIAMENARLITETREALEQQTATAEVLGVINSSPGDLAPVFDVLLEKATEVCHAAFGVMNTYDGERFHTVAVHRLPPALAETYRHERPPPGPHSPLTLIAQGKDVVSINDLTVGPGADLPRRRILIEQGGARSWVAVALRKDGALLGTISAYRTEVRPFSEKEIALLQHFAAQAVIAMENARLITETREALAQQTATAEVLGVINASPGDLQPVFDAMLEKAMRLCGVDFGSLQVYDGQLFRGVAVRGLPEPLAEALRQGWRPGPMNPVRSLLDGARFVHVPDLTQVDVGQSEVRLAVENGSRTLLHIPLRKDDVLLGQIVAVRQEVRPFSDKEIALLENFAAQAVIAMENARLITETREALEQQTATAEVLGVINSSPGDLAPVFDTMLEKALRLCETSFGQLVIYDGECFTPAAVKGAPRAVEWLRQRGPARPGPGTTMDRIARGEPLVHIADVTDDEAYRQNEPSRRALADIGGARTTLSIALRKDDALLGAISIYRQEVRPFTDKQIALVQNFAAQAVIAMENARLISETREALDQQTATAEVLGVINASPGDLTPVFDAILEKAHSLCGAACGGLMTYDGEAFRVVAAHGEPHFVEYWRQEPIRPPEGSPLARVMRGEAIAHIPDAVAEETYRNAPAYARLIDLGGVRSFLIVPLRKDNVLLGVITAYRQEVRPFSDKEIALLQNFAAQAVIAMENARLLTETRERSRDLQESLEYQTATSDVLQIISRSTFDLQPVLDTLVKTAVQLCNADFGNLFRREGDGFRRAAVSGLPPEMRGNVFEVTRGSIVGRVVLEAGIVHVHDVTADPDYLFPDAIRLAGLRSSLGVPLLREGEPIGVFTLGRRRVEPFSERQIDLVRTFADQAVIAMENARLLGELRQRTEEVAELNRGLEERVAEQVEELGRVGRLKRFLAPQLAEMIVSRGDEKILESHRREIVVVFCDLRGYTTFTETAEPEEVLDFLREYHGALGPLVAQFEGTLDQFSGDGIMVFFNDPVPVPDPAERAVNMAVAMRKVASSLVAAWRRRDRDLGFGVGIAQGYATLGQIGFAERSGYTAIGTVCNLAARLCAAAKDGQILISGRVAAAVEIPLEDLGSLALKGLSQPVSAFNVPLAASQPALRVIEGSP